VIVEFEQGSGRSRQKPGKRRQIGQNAKRPHERPLNSKRRESGERGRHGCGCSTKRSHDWIESARMPRRNCEWTKKQALKQLDGPNSFEI
jgi:hypothetical protein